MGFTDWLLGKNKKEVQYPLDPELIKKDEIVKALSQQVQGLQAQIAKNIAKDRQEKEEDIKKEKDQEFIQALNEDEREFKKNRFGRSFSLMKFFRKLNEDRKFREALEVVDKDDVELFGKFGDFLVMEGGYMAITDINGNVISYGKQLSHVFYKPDSLENQIRRGRILTPYDKDYNIVPDMEEVEIPEKIFHQEEQRFYETRILTKKIKAQLIEKDKEIRERTDYAQALEHTNLKLNQKLNDALRTLSFLQNSTDNSQSELSKAMDKSMQFEVKVGDMQRKIVQLTEMKAHNEETILRMEAVIDKLLAKVEEMGDKSDFRKALETVKEVIDYAKTRLPKTITIQSPAEEKPREPTIPGGKMT